jgi:hypothetical protein
MTRLTLAVAVWMSFVPVLSASLTPRKEPRPLAHPASQVKASKVWAVAAEPAANKEGPSEFVVTERTKILLDGKPCNYAAIPGNARIVQMEVAADKKTVLQIHFRTQK